MHHGESTRNPAVDLRVGNPRVGRPEGRRRLRRSRRRVGTDFLFYVPEIRSRARDAGEVRRRGVDHRNLEAFRRRLTWAGDIDVHPIALAVVIAVELGLDPQFLPNPGRGVLKSRDDLRLAVREDRHRAARWQSRDRLRIGPGYHRQHHEWDQDTQGVVGQTARQLLRHSGHLSGERSNLYRLVSRRHKPSRNSLPELFPGYGGTLIVNPYWSAHDGSQGRSSLDRRPQVG